MVTKEVKLMFGMAHNHRAKVIEVYDNGNRAAVEFWCNIKKGKRIECVEFDANTTKNKFFVGQRGLIKYTQVLNGFVWKFKDMQNG